MSERERTSKSHENIETLYAIYGWPITPTGRYWADIILRCSNFGLLHMNGIKILTIKALEKFGIAGTSS
jgi:hypothetical protein